MLDAGQRRLRLQAGKAAHPWENTEQGVTLPWLRDPYSPRYASSCRQRCSAVTGHIGWPAMPRWPELQTNDRSVCGDPRRLRSQVAKRRRGRISTALRPRRAGAAEGVGTGRRPGPAQIGNSGRRGPFSGLQSFERTAAAPARVRACATSRRRTAQRRSALATRASETARRRSTTRSVPALAAEPVTPVTLPRASVVSAAVGTQGGRADSTSYPRGGQARRSVQCGALVEGPESMPAPVSRSRPLSGRLTEGRDG